MSKKKILIFDDDTAILEVITIIFEENGYDVKISETSHDILEKVAEYRPDVILMDNWIPKIGEWKLRNFLKVLKNLNIFRSFTLQPIMILLL